MCFSSTCTKARVLWTDWVLAFFQHLQAASAKGMLRHLHDGLGSNDVREIFCIGISG
ncbi:hypothetical protein C8Q80DRAFT_1197212 [Daedaleopsis nitida]|nr:hypothetical protein C8Q80DRAFT_1197212 [Daedaleopsis nitida]